MYLGYLLKARHTRGHGIHSPYIYSLVSEVLFDRNDYADYKVFRSIRRKMYASCIELEVGDLGADSKCFKPEMRKLRDEVVRFWHC